MAENNHQLRLLSAPPWASAIDRGERGCSADISRCSNKRECRTHGGKSHARSANSVEGLVKPVSRVAQPTCKLRDVGWEPTACKLRYPSSLRRMSRLVGVHCCHILVLTRHPVQKAAALILAMTTGCMRSAHLLTLLLLLGAGPDMRVVAKVRSHSGPPPKTPSRYFAPW
jgi:hypothetical protein